MGGGKDQFVRKDRPNNPDTDNADMFAVFEKHGYVSVGNKQELEKAARGKVLGLFSQRDMPFELDRDKAAEPSIARHDACRYPPAARSESQRFFRFCRVRKYRQCQPPFRCRID